MNSHYSAIAPEYDSVYPTCAALDTHLVRTVSAFCQEHGKAGLRVGDIGCGTASWSHGVARLLANEVNCVIGIDASFAMCREARKRISAVANGDFLMLPLKARSLDICLIKESIHHCTDGQALSRELRDVLCVPGLCVVAVQSSWNLAPDAGLEELLISASRFRKPSREVVGRIFDDEWVELSAIRVACETDVDISFIVRAVSLPALSYWAQVDRDAILTTLSSQANVGSFTLHREFDVFTYASVAPVRG